ncbi:MAG: hypothetical protein JWQ88_1033 [Rhodoferax sp.]|nr:hypothetical protein [Rhodoferax sp.]
MNIVAMFAFDHRHTLPLPARIPPMTCFPFNRRNAVAAWLACALAFPAIAQNTQGDDLLAQARRLLAMQQPAQAYALLDPQEDTRAGDPAFSYVFGIAALDAGHPTRAIFALERVVDMNPADNLARAELARALLVAGEPAAAREQLQLARTGPMPTEAAASIDRVLGALGQADPPAARRVVSSYAEVFAGHDSNVNSATAAGQFALPAFGGIVFNLDAANRQRSDSFAGAAGGMALQLPLAPNWELQAAVNARGLHNRHVDGLDNRQLDASLGLAYQRGPGVVTVAAQANTYDIDDHRYRRASGVTAQWQYALSPAAQVSVFTQWTRLAYAADATRDADRSVLGAGYAHAFSQGRQVAYGSVYRAREKTREAGYDSYGHHANGMRLGAEANLGAQATVFAALQYERRDYGGTEGFFDASRRDRQFDAAVGVRFAPAEGWRITPQVARQRASSNVVLYDYRRTVWQLSLRREFK